MSQGVHDIMLKRRLIWSLQEFELFIDQGRTHFTSISFIWTRSCSVISVHSSSWSSGSHTYFVKIARIATDMWSKE